MPAQAIFITSACEDLNFLIEIVDRFRKELGNHFEHVHISAPGDITYALDRIRQSAAIHVVIFSHGRHGELLGADPLSADDDTPTWLNTQEHSAALSGKEIFCLACKSASLADAAISAGALAFLGFGEVPFQRFNGDIAFKEPELMASCKQHIAEATQLSLLRWLIEGEPLVEIAAFFRLWVRRRTVEAARDNHPFRQGVIDLNLELLNCSVTLTALKPPS